MIKTKHKVFCIIGRTSSGKTELSKRVAKDLNLKILKSYTTREPRINEINNPDADHTFITNTKADCLLKDADVVAYTEINNIRYFATLQQLNENDFYIIDPKGYYALKATLKNWNINNIELIPIYINAFYIIRMFRFIKRNKCSLLDFLKRNNSEDVQFTSFEKSYDGFYINNNLTFDKAIQSFKCYINFLIISERQIHGRK